MAIELAEAKTHLVVKRDGTTEPYSEEKMLKVLLWACDGNHQLASSILQAAEIRIYNKIHISTLFDEMLDTADTLTSRLTPQYEPVAKRLFVQKTYKELWSIKRNEYPHLRDYLELFISNGTMIDVLDVLSPSEIDKLSAAIVPERDLDSTYLGLKTFFSKYSFKHNGVPTELLQHGFMRVAIQAYINETGKDRVRKIIARYNHLSGQLYTEATPKFKNSLRHDFAGASCCVHKMDDNTESINKVDNDIGQYSRADGGNALDISSIRCAGSTIGTKGHSSGPVPVLRKIQGTIELYNQSSTRPGICICYYQWWHADIMALLPLLDEGGSESQRARSLKYSVKVNRLFIDAIENDTDVYLFDPKDVPHFNELYGKEFDKAYAEAVEAKLYKTVIPSRTVALELAKHRLETGNVYIFFSENVNENTPFLDMIHSSNACTEIFLPTKSSSGFKTEVTLNVATHEGTTTHTEATGLTALCNLSSINIDKWMEMSLTKRHTVAAELLEASDNLIDLQFYPTADGEIFNRNYRAIGIGMNNLAYYFAKRGIAFSSDAALGHMTKISMSLKAVFTEESKNLALRRGNFLWHHKTKHVDPARFATLFAQAPGATNSLIIGATEGIEPVSKLISEKTGTSSDKQLAPGLAEFGQNYELSADIPTKSLYDLAAIRQELWLDQGQSINTYAKDATSAYEVISDIIYAERAGLFSLYYLQSATASEGCDSCGA